jgi:hypothetical protein
MTEAKDIIIDLGKTIAAVYLLTILVAMIHSIMQVKGRR